MDDQPLMEIAVKAAKEGGQIALAYFRKPQKVQVKGLRDFAPEGALAVQAKIIEIISQAFPDHHILTEEGAETEPLEEGFQWIIDPIDGSTNYYRGLPIFAISIALWRGLQPFLGVVYDPYHDDLYRAQKHQGAFLNDERLQIVAGEEALDETVVGTDWPRGLAKRANHIKATEIMLREIITLRPLGSPALGICYVASGYLDAYYHLDLKVWDVAAAGVIIEEAGGDISDDQGGYWIYSSGGYLVANKWLHKRVLRVMPK